jgi:hypothetical protein
VGRSFDDLVGEAERAPIDGWDFGWLEGRATEERPSWRYFDLVAARVPTVASLLDVQTGAGTMIADLATLPPLTVASEGHGPNVAEAAQRLRRRGAHLVWTQEDRPALPFACGTFDLVTSRHPVARAAAGRHLPVPAGRAVQPAQPQRGADGAAAAGSRRDPELARRAAERAGLVVTELRHERPLTTFLDIGAVVYFLRLVVWIVPGFSVATHRDRLLALHERIEREGPFTSHASRFLIEATKPR